MFCQECGKAQANVNITTHEGSFHYCEKCAVAKLQHTPAQPTPPQQAAQGAQPQIIAIIPMLQAVPNMPLPFQPAHPAPDASCPTCKGSLTELMLHGKFGCPDCYEAFAGEIRQQIRMTHGIIQYKGKFPARSYRYLRTRKLIRHLQHKLDEEVRNENYEQAVKIRDAIKNLEQEVEKHG